MKMDSEKHQALYLDAWIKQNKIDGQKNPYMIKKDMKKSWTEYKENGSLGGRTKLTFDNWPEKAKIINNMKLKDMSNTEITELTGITLSSVKDFVKRYDLPRKV